MLGLRQRIMDSCFGLWNLGFLMGISMSVFSCVGKYLSCRLSCTSMISNDQTASLNNGTLLGRLMRVVAIRMMEIILFILYHPPDGSSFH